MKRIIEINAAYDKRNPDPKKNYGVHGVEIRFVLFGEKGATQFLLYTNWQLPHVTKEFMKPIMTTRDVEISYLPMPADLGYHSKTPFYDGQFHTEDCPYTGGDCYYDGSTLNAEPVYEALLCEGDNGVWKKLEEYYNDIFGKDENIQGDSSSTTEE